MSIFIKGNVHGDVIEAGGVKNVTNNYHGEKLARRKPRRKPRYSIGSTTSQAVGSHWCYLRQYQRHWSHYYHFS